MSSLSLGNIELLNNSQSSEEENKISSPAADSSSHKTPNVKVDYVKKAMFREFKNRLIKYRKHIQGCNFLYRKNDFKKVKGFNQEQFKYAYNMN